MKNTYHEVVLHPPADGTRHSNDVSLDTVHLEVLRQVGRVGRGRVAPDQLSKRQQQQQKKQTNKTADSCY